jgi:hypothetical protein
MCVSIQPLPAAPPPSVPAGSPPCLVFER